MKSTKKRRNYPPQLKKRNQMKIEGNCLRQMEAEMKENEYRYLAHKTWSSLNLSFSINHKLVKLTSIKAVRLNQDML